MPVPSKLADYEFILTFFLVNLDAVPKDVIWVVDVEDIDLWIDPST